MNIDVYYFVIIKSSNCKCDCNYFEKIKKKQLIFYSLQITYASKSAALSRNEKDSYLFTRSVGSLVKIRSRGKRVACAAKAQYYNAIIRSRFLLQVNAYFACSVTWNLASHFNKSARRGDRNFQRIAAACFLGDCIPTQGKAREHVKTWAKKITDRNEC